MTTRFDGSWRESSLIADKSHVFYKTMLSIGTGFIRNGGAYADVLTVETFHEDFGGGFVDCEEERRMCREGDPVRHALGRKRCFHGVVVLIWRICETRDRELETCHL